MKVIMNGALGKMGRQIWSLLEEGKNGTVIACGVDIGADGSDPRSVKSISDFTGEGDIIIVFSHHACTGDLLAYAIERKLPVIIATTGHTAEELETIRAASEKIAVFHAGNFSLGIAILCDFARRAAAMMPEANIEIIEKHHNQKLDAPSGTALMLANDIKEARKDATFVCGRYGHGKRTEQEIGIHALRLGGVIGEHEVILATPTETITLKHEAHTRALFADGALVAAGFLFGKPAGLYNMKDIVKN